MGQEFKGFSVIVVDDDKLMREEVVLLLKSVGYIVRSYACAVEMLEQEVNFCGVVVTDLRLRGLSGLMLQQRLAAFRTIQIVFISGYAEVEDAVVAMKAGAYEFLEKPFRPQALLDAVGGALAKLEDSREASSNLAQVRGCYDRLTDTERQIAVLVAKGLRNKQIAHIAGKSENTIKVHRGRILQKMGVTSVVDLSRQFRDIGISGD